MRERSAGRSTPQRGYLLGKQLLKNRRRPTAIVSANDQMAFGAMNAARELGLKIPDDLAVVGFDNILLSSYFDPSITTVEIILYETGAEAMRLLMGSSPGKISTS